MRLNNKDDLSGKYFLKKHIPPHKWNPTWPLSFLGLIYIHEKEITHSKLRGLNYSFRKLYLAFVAQKKLMGQIICDISANKLLAIFGTYLWRNNTYFQCIYACHTLSMKHPNWFGQKNMAWDLSEDMVLELAMYLQRFVDSHDQSFMIHTAGLPVITSWDLVGTAS